MNSTMTRRWPLLINGLYPFALALMMGCIAFAAVGWLKVFMPSGWNGTYIILTAILFSLEASYSDRLARIREEQEGEDAVPIGWLLSELLLLAILLRFTRYIGQPFPSVMADIAAWPGHPLQLIDFEYLFSAAIVFPAWVLSGNSIQEMEEAGERPELHRDFVPPLQKLTYKFYWGGGILMFATGLITILPATMKAKTYSLPIFALNLLFYFMFGVLILAQVRMSALTREWEAQRIEIPTGFAGRWLRATILLLTVAVVIAMFLPTGQSIALFDVVGAALSKLALALPAVKIGSDIVFKAPPSPSSPQYPGGVPNLTPRPPVEDNLKFLLVRNPSVLMNVVFWSVLIVLMLVVTGTYFADRPELWDDVRNLRVTRVARHWWGAFFAWLARLLGAVQEHVRARPSIPRPAVADGRNRLRWLRIGNLSPRDQVRFAYLSMVRRAEESGIRRHRADTPYEYASHLEPRISDAQQEVDALTGLFVQARYSDAAISVGEAERAQSASRRVRSELRQRK